MNGLASPLARVRSKSVPVVFLLAVSASAFAQAAAPAPAQQNAAAPAFAYDVVTIKPDDASNNYWRNTADGFSMSGPLFTAIFSAFGVFMDDQISGLPPWAYSEHFAIQAKMDPETAAALLKLPPAEQSRQRMLMLQALLADRFALRFHRTTRELPVYELTVAKSGVRMKKSATETGGHTMYANGKIEAVSTSIPSLTMNLGGRVGRMVVDKTGLEGGYDFTLEYAPDGADASDPRPSIFTALEEQLGLKLVPAKGPADVIVIDRIERPSEN